MRGFYISTTSMLSQQVKLENISNNIANQNTAGYKREETIFRSFRDELLLRTGNPLAGAEGVPSRTVAVPVGTLAQGVGVEEIHTVHLPGTLEETGRPWDFALVGDGFFALQTETGVRYTRDGHFSLDANRYLVDAQGNYLLGQNGPIQLEDGELILEENGALTVDGHFVDNLLIVNFPAEQLSKEGFNSYAALAGAVPLEFEGLVMQGYLEQSNVDLTREMSSLIRIRRSYEAAQKLAQAYDQLLANGANELGVLR